MRRALVPALIGSGVLIAAAPVCAQTRPVSASDAGLRRLDWAGKPDRLPAEAAAPQSPSGDHRPSAAAAAPNRYSSRVGPAEPSRVWNPFPAEATMAQLRPALPAPTAQPAAVVSAPRPRGPAQAAVASRPVTSPPPSRVVVAAPPPPPPPPPAQAIRSQPAPVAAPAAAAAPAPQPSQALAPMPGAEPPPRSYADFSRPVAAQAPATAAVAPARPADAPDMSPPRSYADFSRPMTSQSDAPPRGEPPRYYSLHREYGRQPEHPEIPEAFFIDSVGGEDLAAPPPPPLSEREERRARAAAADPDAPAPVQP